MSAHTRHSDGACRCAQRLDLALRAKDQDKALSGIALVRSSYNDWCTSVGLQ